jgi:hypothetical protein
MALASQKAQDDRTPKKRQSAREGKLPVARNAQVPRSLERAYGSA